MDPLTAIRIGIIVSMAGTMCAGIVALLGGTRAHRVSQWLLTVSAGVGMIASAAFLFSASVPLRIIGGATDTGLRFDLNRLSAIFSVMVNLVAALSAVYAIRYIGGKGSPYRVPSLDALVAVFIIGMQALLLTTNVIGFMVCWEIMSIASFFLVMADREERSISAALLYLVMTHLGAAAILAGFFVVSGGSAFMGFSAITEHASALTPGSTLLAFVLFLVGFGSKAGLVPLHVWLPEAHPQAPSHVSALMSAAMLKMAVYGFIVTTFTMLPQLSVGYGMTIIVVGLGSGVYGALHAVINRDVKQTLAWSSIENLGLIFTMLGVSMFAASAGMRPLADVALIAALFHAFAHAVYKCGLFLSAGIIVHATHTRDLERMGGLAKRMPVLAGSLLILVLTAAALPPFGAFFGEWLFLQGIIGTLAQAEPFVAAVLVVTFCVVVLVSGLAIFAMIKLFAIAMLGLPRSAEAERATEPAMSLRVPVVILACLSMAMGALAPRILMTFDVAAVVAPGTWAMAIRPAGGSIIPLALLLALMVAWGTAYLVRVAMAYRPRVRMFRTWDCGQPIHAGMEYTATAFSAPIRFFFRGLLQSRKEIVCSPVISTNAFVARCDMVMRERLLWMEYLHLPIARFLLQKSAQVKRLQSGVIQFYLILMFLALLVTLVVTV
ncbi:MAG: proton-conducting transporter membrane subunit [bacterium]|nr:proton-conducting transporter membrane subunit [bacterium]